LPAAAVLRPTRRPIPILRPAAERIDPVIRGQGGAGPAGGAGRPLRRQPAL